MKVRVQTDLSLSLYAMTPTRKAYTDLTLPTREKGGVDRFGEYPCVICAIVSCARGMQSMCKRKIHQSCQRD